MSKGHTTYIHIDLSVRDGEHQHTRVRECLGAAADLGSSTSSSRRSRESSLCLFPLIRFAARSLTHLSLSLSLSLHEGDHEIASSSKLSL